MEQKKEEDVLVVRDEKTGEISVVAGLDGKGYPKTKPAKPEHSQDFLRFDRWKIHNVLTSCAKRR